MGDCFEKATKYCFGSETGRLEDYHRNRERWLVCTEFRNLVGLDLEWDAITEILDKNGNRVHTILYESLKTNNSCFHRNCGTKYNKSKLEWFTKKRDNAEQPIPLVRHSSVEKRDFATVFCTICNQTDSSESLHTRGSFHVTKWSVNAKHNKEVTENWKSMALKVGNETFLNHLSTGDDSSTQQTFQRPFKVAFRLIWRRDVAQRQINVETTLCTSTLKFTTLKQCCVFQRWIEQR